MNLTLPPAAVELLTRAVARLATLVRRMATWLRRHPELVTASDAAPRLVIAAEVSGVDTDARTIAGLIVPFGKAGNTSGGRLTFKAGSLKVSEPRRVKLLREHDQRDVVGFATELTETPEGMVGTFTVPEGENGDRALAEAALGLRDAFSVGVQLDDTTFKNLRRSQGAPVAAAGDLREVSLVSVPAFDDARIAASADLVVSSWSAITPTDSTTTTTAGAAGTTREDTMNPEQIARLAALRAQQQLTQAEAAELSQLAALELSTAGASAGTTPEQPATASAGHMTGPAVVPAVAGAATVASEPSTYTFAGSGHSIVSDLYNAKVRGDGEAGQRVERFNAELAAGNPASVNAFVQAAATRDDFDGAGSNVHEALAPASPRPILREAVDAKRPFISRLDRIPISNAQPFAVPAVTAEFEGVGPHTEGTPHRAAGTLTLSGGGMVQPTATSGAWEVSRELLDASNPALDRIAARAMLRDYQRQSEGKLIALLVARAAQEGSTIYGVSDVIKMRGAMLDFVNDDEEPADLVAVSKGMLKTFGLDVDDVNRPQLPFVGAVNALGALRAGYTGVAIDGVEMFRSARLDSALGVAPADDNDPANTTVPGDAGVLARSEGILWAESNVLQFRFDEVLGPGVIKLALWAYSGAAIIDTADVQIVRTGATPVPAV